MKAIETEYKGIFYRSRLEARWAILFDALDLDYVYEPECFILKNDLKYTPDFYLPLYDVYVEIKPNFEWLNIDYHKKRYDLFEKTLVVLSGSFPTFNHYNYINNLDANVVFCPKRKYEPFFYSGEDLGNFNNVLNNENYIKELNKVKKYRFWN